MIGDLVEEVFRGVEIPTDKEIGEKYSISERTVRGIKLEHGLDRWKLKRCQKGKGSKREEKEEEGIEVPFVGDG